MNLYDSPDDDDGLADELHERHADIEHHQHEHEHHHKAYHLIVDRVEHSWPDDYVTGEQILALAERSPNEYEALHIGPGHENDQPIANGERFYLGNEHVHHFRTSPRQ